MASFRMRNRNQDTVMVLIAPMGFQSGNASAAPRSSSLPASSCKSMTWLSRAEIPISLECLWLTATHHEHDCHHDRFVRCALYY